MGPIVSSVSSFFFTPRSVLSSVLLLGTPSLGKYLCKEQYEQKWKWPVNMLVLGTSTLSMGTSIGTSLFISSALLSIGHAIAHLTISRRESSETFHNSVIFIENSTRDGSGVLAKHDTLGYVLITVKHVGTSDAIAHIGERQVSLDKLEVYSSEPNILLFVLGDLPTQYNRNAPVIRKNAKLKIGEKVYFGGYPFGKRDAHFHTGHISSISKDGKFSIDGTAVPGMSGGPIAIEREGKLCVVGAINSETFDPIEGFSKALDQMYCDQADMQIRQEFVRGLKQESKESMLRDPQFTKITRGNLFIGSLEYLKQGDPDCFDKMWDDLNEKGVISDDGEVDPEKIIRGQLGLRRKYQKYEGDIIRRLKAATTDLTEMDSDRIQLPFETKKPTDSMNTVGLSLVQSLSTGIISGNLFKDFREVDYRDL